MTFFIEPGGKHKLFSFTGLTSVSVLTCGCDEMWFFHVPLWTHCSPFCSMSRRSPTVCGFGKVPSVLLCSQLQNEQFGLGQWFQFKKIKLKKQSIRIPCSNIACAEAHQTGVIWAEIRVAGWPPPCSASRVAPEVAPQTPRTPRDHFKHPAQMFPMALSSSRCYSLLF